MKRNSNLHLPFVAILLSALFLTACSDVSSTPNLPTNTPVPTTKLTPTNPPVTSLKVVSVDELAIPTTGIAYLSPDGKLIAWADKTDLCIYSSAGQKQKCFTAKQSIDSYSIRWSPDSMFLTFTEDFFRDLNEPDIWVMEAATGTATDLTEDGQAILKFTDLSKAEFIDLQPSWSADSKSLLFIRYRQGGSIVYLDLYSIAADGKSKAQKLGELSSYRNQNSALVLSPDGKKIAYNKGIDTTEKEPGLWLADLNGKNPVRLIKEDVNPATSITSAYFSVEFSADGKYILGLNLAGVDSSQTYETGRNSRVAAVDGSGELEVASDKQAWWAGWSPKGVSLVYLAYDKAQNALFLYMTDKPGGISRAIYDQPLKAYPNRRIGLSWAANNTLLAINRDNKVLLLHLG